MQQVVPMIHVPDVKATAEWYTHIGFKLIRQNEEDGEINWASLQFENSELMLNSGGQRSRALRREVDLYIRLENIETLFQRVKEFVEIVEPPHDTFYGMREFIVKDLNGFWLTFGQPIAR